MYAEARRACPPVRPPGPGQLEPRLPDPYVTMTCMAGAVDYEGAVTPNPVLMRDATTLVGLLAYVEGALLDGSVTEHWARKLHDRFVRDGLLPPVSTDRDVRQVLNDVNHRLRYAIGDYPDPPSSVSVS